MIDLEKFRSVRALVVGDPMLDVTYRGKANRVSPEAPCIVLDLDTGVAEYALGGALNVCANLKTLGGKEIHFAGVGGQMAWPIEDLLVKAGILGFFVRDLDRPMTRKIRFFAGHHQLLRADHETSAPISKNDVREVLARIQDSLATAEHDVFVVSDYAKGGLTNEVLRAVVEAAGERPIIVNTKTTLWQPLNKQTVVIVNDELDIVVPKIMDRARALIVTRGPNATLIYANNEPVTAIDPVPHRVFDVQGAGDTFTAAIAMYLAAGGDNLSQACQIANAAAGVVVQKPGTATCSLDELVEALG